jgi:hypothetical protein
VYNKRDAILLGYDKTFVALVGEHDIQVKDFETAYDMLKQEKFRDYLLMREI